MTINPPHNNNNNTPPKKNKKNNKHKTCGKLFEEIHRNLEQNLEGVEFGPSAGLQAAVTFVANGLILDQVLTSCSEGEGPLRTFLACLGAARAQHKYIVQTTIMIKGGGRGGSKNKGPFVVGSERFWCSAKTSHQANRRVWQSHQIKAQGALTLRTRGKTPFIANAVRWVGENALEKCILVPWLRRRRHDERLHYISSHINLHQCRSFCFPFGI